jgi:hypothetical protein
VAKFTLPNDFKGDEMQELVKLLRQRASSFLDWGYDEKCFWIQVSSQARNPWPDILRELFTRSTRASSQSSTSDRPQDSRI